MGFYYYYLHLKDGLYVEDIRQRLGAYFDYAVNGLQISGQEAAGVLVDSGLARELEVQNPRFVAGMSGIELLTWAYGSIGRPVQLDHPECNILSQDYWLGYMLGYFQCMTGWEYKRIFETVSYADLREMFYSTQDLSEDDYVKCVLNKLNGQSRETRLAALRKAAGWTQQQLADKVGISYRAIQQYEQGQKDINKAAAETVRKLSLVFGCAMEEVMEPPVRTAE